MDQQELRLMLKDIESDLVERKASLSNPDRVRQAICAYANDLPAHHKPGVIFVGANDDGSCAGLKVTDELLLQLSHMRDDGKIQPIPSITVEKNVINGCEMVVIVVNPSLAPPIRLNGVTWIRVGPRRAIATPEEEKCLAERRRSRDLPFDLQPVPTATIIDLDLDSFEREYLPLAIAPEVLEQNTRSTEDKLKALRFLTPDGQPTVLGILVIGKEILDYIPGAYVQFLRLEGTELTDPIRDQKEIAGPLRELLMRIDDVLEANNSVYTSITSGGPFGQVTKENFGQPGVTDYRNPHLAEAMRVLGYVQRFGLGIQIARKQLDENGNPAPEFDVEQNLILVTVRRR